MFGLDTSESEGRGASILKHRGILIDNGYMLGKRLARGTCNSLIMLSLQTQHLEQAQHLIAPCHFDAQSSVDLACQT